MAAAIAMRMAAALASLSLPADARDAMRARLDAALAGNGVDVAATRAANGEAGAILAASAELVAGVESPDDAKALRRRLQLERLAERMRGGATLEPPAELRAILLEWCALGPMEPAVREALAQRVYASIDACRRLGVAPGGAFGGIARVRAFTAESRYWRSCL